MMPKIFLMLKQSGLNVDLIGTGLGQDQGEQRHKDGAAKFESLDTVERLHAAKQLSRASFCEVWTKAAASAGRKRMSRLVDTPLPRCFRLRRASIRWPVSPRRHTLIHSLWIVFVDNPNILGLYD